MDGSLNNNLKAAKMAGDWWAERLDDAFKDQRGFFSASIAIRVYAALNKGEKRVILECDYDPKGILLEAVREAIAPDCNGWGFSAKGILPNKHLLIVTAESLTPKEGYGEWTLAIPVY